MSQYDVDIADMQCWVFRMAQTKWNTPCALADVETLLKNRGVSI